jgi:hypothetical protein
MIANAAFVATLIFLALGFWSMHTLHFLTPWRSLIVHSMNHFGRTRQGGLIRTFYRLSVSFLIFLVRMEIHWCIVSNKIGGLFLRCMNQLGSHQTQPFVRDAARRVAE